MHIYICTNNWLIGFQNLCLHAYIRTTELIGFQQLCIFTYTRTTVGSKTMHIYICTNNWLIGFQNLCLHAYIRTAELIGFQKLCIFTYIRTILGSKTKHICSSPHWLPSPPPPHGYGCATRPPLWYVVWFRSRYEWYGGDAWPGYVPSPPPLWYVVWFGSIKTRKALKHWNVALLSRHDRYVDDA